MDDITKIIIAAISSGAFSTILTIIITSKQTIRKAAAEALSDEAGAVKNAIGVWQTTVEFLGARVTTLEEEIVIIRKERIDLIDRNDTMLKSIVIKDDEIAKLMKEISGLNMEINALKTRIISLEEKLLK